MLAALTALASTLLLFSIFRIIYELFGLCAPIRCWPIPYYILEASVFLGIFIFFFKKWMHSRKPFLRLACVFFLALLLTFVIAFFANKAKAYSQEDLEKECFGGNFNSCKILISNDQAQNPSPAQICGKYLQTSKGKLLAGPAWVEFLPNRQTQTPLSKSQYQESKNYIQNGDYYFKIISEKEIMGMDSNIQGSIYKRSLPASLSCKVDPKLYQQCPSKGIQLQLDGKDTEALEAFKDCCNNQKNGESCNRVGMSVFFKNPSMHSEGTQFWFQKSCDYGFAGGCMNLASEYKHSGDKIKEKAAYQKACKAGDALACLEE